MACSLPLSMACGMIAATEIEVARNAACSQGGFNEPRTFRCIRIGAGACATAAVAQTKPPLKLGGILDMSGLYADITGPGSEMAAKMAAEDFGGEVLGRKIEIIAADHLNKADLAANIARDMFDNQGVEMLFDVAASATALAALEISKARGKINMFNGPGRSASPTRPAAPTPCIMCSIHSRRPMSRPCRVKQGLDSWFFLTADYAFDRTWKRTPPTWC